MGRPWTFYGAAKFFRRIWFRLHTPGYVLAVLFMPCTAAAQGVQNVMLMTAHSAAATRVTGLPETPPMEAAPHA